MTIHAYLGVSGSEQKEALASLKNGLKKWYLKRKNATAATQRRRHRPFQAAAALSHAYMVTSWGVLYIERLQIL